MSLVVASGGPAPRVVFPTVPQMFEASARRWPARIALQWRARAWSYSALHLDVERLATILTGRALTGPGRVAALLLPNHSDGVLLVLAALRAGAAMVLLSPLDAPIVQIKKLRNAGADLLVADPAFCQAELVADMQSRGGTVVWAGDCLPEQVLPPGQRLLALLQGDEDISTAPLPDVSPESTALLQYTGGTTGEPKAAILTHANLTSVCEQFWQITRGEPPILREGDESLLLCLPLFHVFALAANLLLGIRLGATILLHEKFDAAQVLRCIADQKITMFSGVPTMYGLLLQHPACRSEALSSLRYCLSGGAPLSAETHQKFEALSGLRLTEGWGMTETSSGGCYAPPNGRVKPGSCGVPLPGVTLQLRDLNDSERLTPLGKAGELCIQGPNVMRGYLGGGDGASQAFTSDGFLRTGDIAVIDHDGDVHIVDRLKDMILCGGYNVYPRTIESALYEHPAVQEVLVVGVPDAKRGQAPKAFLQLRPGHPVPSLDAVQTFLRSRVGKHELVQAIEIRAELPRTAVGKLSKKDLT